MSKFKLSVLHRSAGRGVIHSGVRPTARTYEGALAWTRDERSELFLLAVTNMVGEDTFYEGASEGDSRFVELVHRLAVSDGEWTARLIEWLRTGAQLRWASLVAAAEFVAARWAAGISVGHREVIASSLQRADEPGELIGYWFAQHGRAIPQPVKRGVADAVRRLYSERSLLKWDSELRAVRLGDVLELVHAAPVAAWQGDLFAYAISRRHNRADVVPSSLATLGARAELTALPVDLHGGAQTRHRAPDPCPAGAAPPPESRRLTRSTWAFRTRSINTDARHRSSEAA